ncbi:MAG: hypothetical protein JO141_00390, partial [Bradyrhizobium sp.]|nr:hypothetical protein [Bradyrhizobium sp.]
MMMILSKLNSIAARITIAIVLAIILGLVIAFGLSVSLNSYGSRQDRSAYASDRAIIIAVITHRNLMMLSGEIAMAIRTVASVPRSERPKVIAISASAAPDLRIALDESAPAQPGTSVDYNLDRLRGLVQLQLRGLSPSILVSAHRLPVQTDQPGDRDQSRSSSEEDGVLEAELP